MEGGLKKLGKKAGREEKETEKAGENMVTKDRLRCENIGSVFYSSIIYHSWTLCQFYSSCQKKLEKGLSSKLCFGILPKSMHQIAQIRFENCKIFIASEGAHLPQTPPSKQGRSVKCQLIICEQYFACLNMLNQ